MYNKLINQKGETLIEALGALAIVAIVISAVATSVIASISNTKYNQNTTISAKYAQQALEQVREIRNSNYTAFKNYSGNYCLGKAQTSLGAVQGSCPQNFDVFSRSVQIQQAGCGANVAQISATVAFTDGKCTAGVYCHKVTQTTCVSTVNPFQGP
jgi:type II secretory pathway pseudopilin PulG